MPQASDELCDLMCKWFGNRLDDWPPWRLLESHGYTETNGYIQKPTPAHSVSADEWACIDFLCQEWDYAFGAVILQAPVTVVPPERFEAKLREQNAARY
jgi:hypothetical protein